MEVASGMGMDAVGETPLAARRARGDRAAGRTPAPATPPATSPARARGQKRPSPLQVPAGPGKKEGAEEEDADLNLFELYIEILGSIAQWKRQGVSAAPFEQLRREFSSKGPEYFAMRQDATSRAEWTRLVGLVDAAQREREAMGDEAPLALQSFFPVWDQFRTGVEAVQRLQDPEDLKRLMEQSLCGLFSPRNKGHASKLLAKARDKHQVMAAASSISAIAASKLAAEYRSVSDTILNSGSHLQVQVDSSPLVKRLIADGFRPTDQENTLGQGNHRAGAQHLAGPDASSSATAGPRQWADETLAADALGAVSRARADCSAPQGQGPSRTFASESRLDAATAANGDESANEELDIDASERATLELLSSLAQYKSARALLTPRRAALTPRSALTIATAGSNPDPRGLGVLRRELDGDDENDGATSGEESRGRGRRARSGSDAASRKSNAAAEDSGPIETLCSVCAKEIEEKDFADAVGCDFRSCSKWFHRRCVSFEGGENVALPEPWFCHTCIAPTIKHLEKVHQQSRSKGTRRSLTHLLPSSEQAAAAAADGSETASSTKPSRAPEAAPQPKGGRSSRPAASGASGATRASTRSQQGKAAETISETAPAPTAAQSGAVKSTRGGGSGSGAGADAGDSQTRASGKRRGSFSSTSGSGTTRPGSPKRRKYEFKNDLVLKRNPHQTTIVDLVEHGYLKPGDVISVPYLNKHRFEGVINEDGLIEFESNVFISPPSFALYCKRKIYKNKQSDRGWTSCFHGTTPLLHYRNQFLKTGKD